MQAGLLKNFQIEDNIKILHLHCTSFFLCSEQKAYLEKVKQERLVKEELMSQDDEEDIPVTEREMNLKVTDLQIILLLIWQEIQTKFPKVHSYRASLQTGT